MRIRMLVILAAVVIPHGARAVTLTITPDQAVYQVGDTITLNVFGDAEGADAGLVFGRILFDADLASYVTSHQEQLTSFGGDPWILLALTGGAGFGDAFSQLISVNPFPVDGPLRASVTLLATAPGILGYSWQDDMDIPLEFFDIATAPGGSVVIVPEPSTRALLGLGTVALAIGRRSIRRR